MKHTVIPKNKLNTEKQLPVSVNVITRLSNHLYTVFPFLFFGLFFIFLLFYVDPELLYSTNGFNIHRYVFSTINLQKSVPYTDPWFLDLFTLECTPEYLHNCATTPGGWTKFIVTLFIYSCHFPVLGAFLLTGFALFLSLIFALYIKGINISKLYYLQYISTFFILAICAWYELRYLAFLVPVAGALAFSIFYNRFGSSGILKRILSFTVLFCISWYFIQWGSFLFLMFVLVQEFHIDKRDLLLMIFASIINAVLLFLLDYFFIPLNKTIPWRDFMALSGFPLLMVLFFPIAVIFLSIIAIFSSKSQIKESSFSTIAQTTIFVCCTVVIAIWLYRDPVNHTTRTIARTVHNLMNRQWDAILHEKTDDLFSEFPKKAGPLQIFMVHTVNQALCRTDQAGDRLFRFPQAVFTYDPLLMLESTLRNGVIHWVVVLELVMDLGMVNSAEKIAGEIMETMGPYPDIIYRRALIQLAKGNNGAASVYLNRLLHMPFYRAKAKQMLDNIDNKKNFLNEPRIAAMNVNKDTLDYFLFNMTSHDAVLRNLLQSNPGNRLAYNYLMSYCLLTGQLDDFTFFSQAASSFGYTALPRYWEEAVCMNQAVKAQRASSETPFSGLRQETVERFIKFTQAWLRMENDPEAAAVKLAPEFGDSYFYFSMFRHSRGVFHE